MELKDSRSFDLARRFLGKEVEVVIDRPLGSKHPQYPDHIYEVNSGYIPGIIAPDGKELDAHCIGWREPLDKIKGRAIAIIHRLDDDDDKLIVAPVGSSFTDEEIERAVHFQEKYYKHIIVR